MSEIFKEYDDDNCSRIQIDGEFTDEEGDQLIIFCYDKYNYEDKSDEEGRNSIICISKEKGLALAKSILNYYKEN